MNKRNHLHPSLNVLIFSKLLLFCCLQSLQKYLAASTINAGLQVVDVEKANLAYYNPEKPSAALVGGFDTVNGLCGPTATDTCGQPHNVIAYRSGYVLMTTMRGYTLIIDVNMPTLPTLAGYYKPETNSYWAAAAASDYSYTNSSGTKNMDLAIIGSWGVGGGKVHLLDITDPAHPNKISTVKDKGQEVTGVVAGSIVISKKAKLAYISSLTALYVIDIKDPYNPVLLNRIGNETYTVVNSDGSTSSSTIDLGNLRGIAELDGWVYLTNMQNGLKVVNLGAFNVNVVDKKGADVVEAKYGDGKDDIKDCFIRIKVEDAEEECNDQNLQGTIAAKTVEGNVEKDVEVPAGIGYPAKYDLTFEKESNTNNCMGNIKTPDGVKKQVFISNRKKDDLPATTGKAPLFGGIIELTSFRFVVSGKNMLGSPRLDARDVTWHRDLGDIAQTDIPRQR